VTDSGFQIVTGISTGALIAPFAFLGPDYDPLLREVYTQFSTDHLTEPRGPLLIVRGDAVTSTRLLRGEDAGGAVLDDDAVRRVRAHR
jgi:hypothetical protein